MSWYSGPGVGKGWGAAGWGSSKGDHWSGGKGDAWAGGSDDHWTWDSTASGEWPPTPSWQGVRRDSGKNKNKEKEKEFRNVTYLGCGRHRLPLEDRCTLAGTILESIFDDTGVQIPTMVVASWKEKTCNAFFYLLAQAQPSTRLQQMVPRDQKFTLEESDFESDFG